MAIKNELLKCDIARNLYCVESGKVSGFFIFLKFLRTSPSSWGQSKIVFVQSQIHSICCCLRNSKSHCSRLLITRKSRRCIP